jgi:hypothetical protein
MSRIGTKVRPPICIGETEVAKGCPFKLTAISARAPVPARAIKRALAANVLVCVCMLFLREDVWKTNLGARREPPLQSSNFDLQEPTQIQKFSLNRKFAPDG